MKRARPGGSLPAAPPVPLPTGLAPPRSGPIHAAGSAGFPGGCTGLGPPPPQPPRRRPQQPPPEARDPWHRRRLGGCCRKRRRDLPARPWRPRKPGELPRRLGAEATAAASSASSLRRSPPTPQSAGSSRLGAGAGRARTGREMGQLRRAGGPGACWEL